MKRDFYSSDIPVFAEQSENEILGILAQNNEFNLEQTTRESWVYEINLLKTIFREFKGRIFFEYSIPRMGRRIDVVAIIKNVIFVLEFKVGEKEYLRNAIDQVWDYAIDLKNFHETSQPHLIAPILVATMAPVESSHLVATSHDDKVLLPIKANSESLLDIVREVLDFADGESIDIKNWINGRYSPSPTIIEAATALYNNHSVVNISRSDASAINLTKTSRSITEIIEQAKSRNKKVICFVTGVPGAGKTLVGLDVATKHMDMEKLSTSVYLSGNGPLVAILREALTRDRVKREKEKGNKVSKGKILSEVKMMIQNVHHFRDEYLRDPNPPFDHVAIFDEAQRAWNLTQTVNFMQRKKKVPNFQFSEPEFLISCLDRHNDWAAIVCLVGGGQEINTGEAGIGEWIESINRRFNDWQVYISSRLTDSEYDAAESISLFRQKNNVLAKDELHLSVSMRSFRSEHLSTLIKNILEINIDEAKKNYTQVRDKYPIVITRDLSKAKKWLKEMARGSERYGIVVSSQAQRLKPFAIDVRSPIDPVHWFLDEKEDTRSSYYLEDVATEFHVQGLELDWACITWDGDFRYSQEGWKHFSFSGSKWKKIKSAERKKYLKNAYRVLLTRARQGMIIVVPTGDIADPTRDPNYYDSTYAYLTEIGFKFI